MFTGPQFIIAKNGDFLVAQWLRLCPSTAAGTGSILGQETKEKNKQKPRSENNSNMLQWVNGLANCGTFISWNDFVVKSIATHNLNRSLRNCAE